jgi:hypothetical protein
MAGLEPELVAPGANGLETFSGDSPRKEADVTNAGRPDATAGSVLNAAEDQRSVSSA